MVIGALGAPVAAATVIYAMRIVVYGAGIEGYGGDGVLSISGVFFAPTC